MKTVLFFLYILGTAAAIPAEKSSVLKSKEENHDQSADQDQSYSPELRLQDEEESESDLSENLEYIPSEGTLDLQEDGGEPQKKKVPENIDSFAPNISSTIDPNQQESITKTEKEQEQPINDLHPQLNRSNKDSQDVSDQGNQEQDPNIPNGEEEGEEEPGEVGTHNDNQERGRELPKEHSNSKEEEDSTQSDDVLEESSQPTQVSKMQKDEFDQGNQEQEEDSSNAEMEDESASKINKHNQDAEWQSQEEKPDVISNHEEIDKKSVSEALPLEPTEAGNIMPRNHGANADGDDDPRHDAGDDYEFIPSETFVEAERSQSIAYNLKYEEEKERERAHENGNVDASEPGEYQEAKKAESSPKEDESSYEDNRMVHGRDSCMNFQCKRGHICKADQQGKPHCVCQDSVTCPPTKLLDQVCGTDNQTYPSSCHLFATKCKLEGTKKGHQLQLDYFGACKSIPICTDFEVTQFPLRMRDWLKNILMQLYEANPEHAGYLNEKQRNKVKKIYLDEKRLLAGDHSIDLLLRDFKKNYHMYVYPVHWQFGELDQHPMDRVLTHSELAPLRASLVPMEHCITRFFEECDPNKDKHITLMEWGHCFGIKEEDIDENLLF
ncbi:SPARC-like protein 1 isoform X3 [Enhydra lutris kenyoni]|uniref:SPARC n=1 Tax=Enhydra lutris kenyoni TaxID=391180 RepID=A0A2Y9K4A7_ENHLU|nr:SPARC-like protein 1 isoform X3 [Enhydra lutris kenyoni]